MQSFSLATDYLDENGSQESYKNISKALLTSQKCIEGIYYREAGQQKAVNEVPLPLMIVKFIFLLRYFDTLMTGKSEDWPELKTTTRRL